MSPEKPWNVSLNFYLFLSLSKYINAEGSFFPFLFLLFSYFKSNNLLGKALFYVNTFVVKKQQYLQKYFLISTHNHNSVSMKAIRRTYIAININKQFFAKTRLWNSCIVYRKYCHVEQWEVENKGEYKCIFPISLFLKMKTCVFYYFQLSCKTLNVKKEISYLSSILCFLWN